MVSLKTLGHNCSRESYQGASMISQTGQPESVVTPPSQAPKRPYEPPRLQPLGSLRVALQGGEGSFTENLGGSDPGGPGCPAPGFGCF